MLVDGVLEASFPSSHMLIVCSFLTAAVLQLKERIQNKNIRMAVMIAAVLIIVLTAVGRLLSGMHWFTDILGSLLLSNALVMLYKTVVGVVEK